MFLSSLISFWSKAAITCKIDETIPEKKKACVLIANGSEDMETAIITDVLRRGCVTVELASVNAEGTVKCGHDLVIQPDTTLESAMQNDYDMIVLPGGADGARVFRMSADVGKFLKNQEKHDKYIAAICASPTVLKTHAIYHGKRLTSYPAMAGRFTSCSEYIYSEEKVVCDGKLITSRGPGTAIHFALVLVAKLQGAEKAKEVAQAMLTHYIPC